METISLLGYSALFAFMLVQLVKLFQRVLAYKDICAQRAQAFGLELTALFAQQGPEMLRAQALGVSHVVVRKRHAAQHQALLEKFRHRRGAKW